MNSLLTILLSLFMIMLWGFRIIVTFMEFVGLDFAIQTINVNAEIILLFIDLLCIILVVKRKMLGGIIYVASHGVYFGIDLFNTIMKIINNEAFDLMIYTNAFVSLIGIGLPLIVLIDLLLDKNRKAHPVDKKTDWFYKNKEYDRKFDERADKNNYRTL